MIALNHIFRQNIGSNASSTRPSWTSSDRFDDQFTRHLKVYSLTNDGAGSPLLPRYGKGRAFESNWVGEWCVSRSFYMGRSSICSLAILIH